MFESLLLNLKSDMLPLCGQIAVIAKVIAVLGCLISIAMTTIKSMADLEPINFWKYIKPVTLAMCIMMFEPVVIGSLDGILQPLSRATSAIAETQETDYFDKSDQLEEERNQLKPNQNVVYYLTEDEQIADASAEEGKEEVTVKDYDEIARKKLAADIEYKKTWILSALESLLQVFSYAAKMIINIVGTFFLIILAIMGPLAFAAACFPILENSLSGWLTHYITISLWLPIANLLTAVLSRAQAMLCEQQLSTISETGAANSVLILAMMVVGIFGYMSVPSVANWIVQAGGSGSFTRNMTQAGKQAMGGAVSGARSKLSGIAGKYGGGFKDVASIIKGGKYGV